MTGRAKTRREEESGGEQADTLPDGVPAIVAWHDACLGIAGTGEKARRVRGRVFQGLQSAAPS